MTCQECELALGSEQSSPSLDRHMSECHACRALALDLLANSEGLASLRSEAMPSVRHCVMIRVRTEQKSRKIARWGWALAAAAMIAVVFAPMRSRVLGLPANRRIEKLARPLASEKSSAIEHASAIKHASIRHMPKRLTTRRPEMLKVKMLTSDPDVVIYWIVETKEGSE
jgi:hypothetical protein